MNGKLNNPRSSVPLPVYRELMKELLSTQARLEAVQAENQQLRLSLAQKEQVQPQIAIAPLPVLPEPTPSSPPKHQGIFLAIVVFLIVVTCGLGAFWSVRFLVKR